MGASAVGEANFEQELNAEAASIASPGFSVGFSTFRLFVVSCLDKSTLVDRLRRG